MSGSLLPEVPQHIQLNSVFRAHCLLEEVACVYGLLCVELYLYFPKKKMVKSLYETVIFTSLFLLLVTDYTLAIKCYTCSTRRNPEECLRPEKYSIPKKHCNMLALNDTLFLAKEIEPNFSDIFDVELTSYDPMLPTACIKQITQVGERREILRGCQLVAHTGNLNVCNKVKKYERNLLRTTFCELCTNRDGCNSSTKSKGIWIFVSVLVLAVLHIAHVGFC